VILAVGSLIVFLIIANIGKVDLFTPVGPGDQLEELSGTQEVVSSEPPNYLTQPIEKEFTYVLRGTTGQIEFTLYKGLNEYLARKPRTYYCPPDCSQEEIERKMVFEPAQAKELDKLVELIQEETEVKDDQARIAISLVQKIPYDWDSLNTELDLIQAGYVLTKYPYQVLYDNAGVCGEKSKLMAYLLKELGYEVILMDYKAIEHQAVGLKCPTEYSVNGNGYCFIEASAPSIITDTQGDYIGRGALPATPTSTLKISGGTSFDSVKEEYDDAQEWNKLLGMGTMLPRLQYNRWRALVTKYGIEPS